MNTAVDIYQAASIIIITIIFMIMIIIIIIIIVIIVVNNIITPMIANSCSWNKFIARLQIKT